MFPERASDAHTDHGCSLSIELDCAILREKGLAEKMKGAAEDHGRKIDSFDGRSAPPSIPSFRGGAPQHVELPALAITYLIECGVLRVV